VPIGPWSRDSITEIAFNHLRLDNGRRAVGGRFDLFDPRNGPAYSGLIKISSAPLLAVLEQLGRP
jgi:hypothetical protein